MPAFFSFWGWPALGKQSPVRGQLQAMLRAPSPPLPSSIYRSYFGNFLSELKAHSWDSVTTSPAGKPGISWRLLEPLGPCSLLFGEEPLVGSPLRLLHRKAPSLHPARGLTRPAREARIPARWILPGVSASTCPTRLGMRRLSRMRTQPTHHHVHLEAGVAPKPQTGPTSLLREGAQILLDPTQCLADDSPRSPPGSPRKRPQPSLGGAPSLVTARPSGLSQAAVARPLDFGF